ncbi:extracellular solute-binding protein [Sinorhizobium sp. Sb3]|uniref:extracellular solute-binding protein n=1 Tax=Sinorhizobium/Ensifer group TaxID=227292 RepID=UPI00071D4DB4|nr:extracellular solute-binding protein [Sinorhizobium sp. Sb3]KSV61060.1 hypothetical protein N183_10670 [Sinorhizobium sp. Sb3]
MIRANRMTLLLAALIASTGIAHAEGELNIYNWGNYTSPEMVKKFEQAFDVKVTVTDYDSSDTALAKARQGGSGYDVVVVNQVYVPIWVKEGLLMELDPGQMENFKNVAPEWVNADFDPGRKYTVPWAVGTTGVVVNGDAYKGDADSWSIVFNPPEELKGKVNVVPELNDVMAAAIQYVGGEQCTADKAVLKKVRDLLVNAKADWIAMEYNTIEKMAAGDFKATLAWNGAGFRARMKNPAISFHYPREGYGVWSDNAAVLKDAKNVDNAKLFINFVMDPENAAMNSAFHGYANGIAGSEKFMPDTMKNAPEIVIPAERREGGQLQRLCSPEAQDLYKRIWTDLRK